MRTFTKSLIATGLALLATAAVHAAPIVGVVSVSSPIGQLDNSIYKISNLINQSGLSATYVSGVTDFSAFVATTTLTSNPSSSNGWASTVSNPFPAAIDFDFGVATTLSRLALWNDTDGQALGAFQVFASADASYSTLTSLGSFTGAIQNVGTLGQVFDFTDANTRYLRIVGAPVINYNGLLNIGEIAFEGTSNKVPEPGSLLLVGVALAGLALRQRRSQA